MANTNEAAPETRVQKKSEMIMQLMKENPEMGPTEVPELFNHTMTSLAGLTLTIGAHHEAVGSSPSNIKEMIAEIKALAAKVGGLEELIVIAQGLK